MKNKDQNLPGIKSLVPTKKISYSRLSLSLHDKQFLLRKYMKAGDTFEKAKIKVSNFCDKLKELMKNLKEEKVEECQINDRFKQEFEKVCRTLD